MCIPSLLHCQSQGSHGQQREAEQGEREREKEGEGGRQEGSERDSGRCRTITSMRTAWYE